ncbi:outer membrane lipoprotein chaperone LolA [soil metagenome]
MYRNLVCVAAMALASVSFASPASDASAEPGLARVQRFLDRIDTLRADFRQTVEDAESRVVQASEGVLTIARPDRFRWDYSKPYEQLVLADGEQLWLYDADLEQVTVRALDESLASTPAMLLSGGGRLEDAFRSGEVSEQPWGLTVELIPTKNNSDFQSITVSFEGDNLTSMQLRDALGQLTRIEFSAVECNPQLADTAFTFDPPEGVDVIGAPAPR